MKHGHTLMDHDSNALLYEWQAPAILAYLYRQTSSWDDAEDLLVEVFLAALEYKYFGEMSESEQQSWLWKVTRNKLADRFRYSKRYPSLPLNLELAEAVLEDDALTPEKSLLKQEEYAHLHATLRTLSQVQQDVLALRFGHGLSCKQIGTVLEKTEGSVRMLLFRTLKHLRSIYKKF